MPRAIERLLVAVDECAALAAAAGASARSQPDIVSLEPGNFAWFPKPWKVLAPTRAIWSPRSE